ncbi:MAG: hypothetical protein NT069_35440, partial [Planctomycetota bacterium]|nr:hypothetical protein [Planctomycetota bacterium]
MLRIPLLSSQENAHAELRRTDCQSEMKTGSPDIVWGSREVTTKLQLGADQFFFLFLNDDSGCHHHHHAL